MSRKKFVEKLATNLGVTYPMANNILNNTLKTFTQYFTEEDILQMVGFGTFRKSVRSARLGRNPKTGEEIKIKAKQMVKFKPGKNLLDAVNGVKKKDTPAKKVADTQEKNNAKPVTKAKAKPAKKK